MPIVPNCADCQPLSLPSNVNDYTTRQEVINATSHSNQVQVLYMSVSKGKTAVVNLATRRAGATGTVLLIPLSGDPNLSRIFTGSASHPDFDWTPAPRDLQQGAYLEGKKFQIPYAEPLSVVVTSMAATSSFALLYWES